ncbi:MAG: hypothetical protein WAX44_01000 [Minisyncoccia bacterium]
METLARLFGSETKVKILRLFLFNDEHVFYMKEIVERTKSDLTSVKKEMPNLLKMSLIRKRKIKGKHGYSLNTQFLELRALRSFLVNLEPLSENMIIKNLSKAGSLKLILTAGIFIQDPESRVDILVVGDAIKKAGLEKAVKILESEVGKELKYAYFSTNDFKYRISMFDKLTRDILDYPHKIVLNKLGNL